MAKQRKIKLPGQPAPRWPMYMQEAHRAIVARGGYRPRVPVIEQLARQIVANDQGEAFLHAVRRGRPTARQNLRYQLLREVEAQIGAAVPRRREDRNTPEAAPRQKLELSGSERCDCDCATKCPLGKVGSAYRCTKAELLAAGFP